MHNTLRRLSNVREPRSDRLARPTERSSIPPASLRRVSKQRAAGARHPFDHGLHQALRGDSVQEHAPRAARHATAAMNPQRVHRNDAPEFTDLVGRDDLSEILAILAEAQQRAGLLSGATLGPGRAHRSARRRSSGQAPISLPRKGDTESIRTTDPDVPTDTSRGKTAIRRAEDLR
ncbi:hypothetical protein Mapa_015699 [Marchantia paleacea]|nr:hypothetical protein Mapa_015699 [Marchantia paleacea]